MYRYRIYVKDCLNLGGRAKSNVECLSFDIRRDLLEKSVSTFNVERIETNIDVGDVLGLYDEYGTVYYIGVINELDTTSNQITCNSNINYFAYTWLYDALNGFTGTTEEKLRKLFNDVFINSNDYLMRTKYGNINIVLKSNFLTFNFPTKEEHEVLNFEDFLYECYLNYGIVCNLSVPFEIGTPVLTIDASTSLRDPIKIGNNFNAIQNFRIETDTVENNKLIIYSNEGEYRATYFATQNGITQDDESPLRLKKINNVIVFSDDDINLILTENLDDYMYNHKITFDLLLNNTFYDFFSLFALGCPVEIWYNGVYFNSVFTGFQFIKEENIDVSLVNITCGKVRNTLTSKLLKYVR